MFKSLSRLPVSYRGDSSGIWSRVIPPTPRAKPQAPSTPTTQVLLWGAEPLGYYTDTQSKGHGEGGTHTLVHDLASFQGPEYLAPPTSYMGAAGPGWPAARDVRVTHLDGLD